MLDAVEDELEATLMGEEVLDFEVASEMLVEDVEEDCAPDVDDSNALVGLVIVLLVDGTSLVDDDEAKVDELLRSPDVDDAGVELEVSEELVAEVDMELLVALERLLLVEEDAASLEVTEADSEEEELVTSFAPQMWFSLIAGPTELLR